MRKRNTFQLDTINLILKALANDINWCIGVCPTLCSNANATYNTYINTLA